MASDPKSAKTADYSADKPPCARSSSTETALPDTVETRGMERSIADFTTHLRDRNRSPITIARYTDLLRRFTRFACAELHQDMIAPDQIDKALVVLFIREGGMPGTQASAATRNSRLAAIRAFFRFLLADEHVTRDPTASVHSATLPDRAPTFLNAEEFTKLCRAVEEHASEFYLRRDMAILVTLWNSGLRLAELLSLDLGVIDFEGEVFRRVRRKGGKVLPVYFNVDVTIALRRWLWQRKEYPQAITEAALFLSDRGRRLSPRAVEDVVGKYAGLAGIDKHVTPHVLRHSTATALIRAGNGIEVVADVLAHSSLDTTRHYVHLVGEQVHAAVASLAEPSRRRGWK
jgi:site-specific recombinase XerD